MNAFAEVRHRFFAGDKKRLEPTDAPPRKEKPGREGPGFEFA